jgi:CelD/BcsL family acetyltransferase involved in cellulose biosynthesis
MLFTPGREDAPVFAWGRGLHMAESAALPDRMPRLLDEAAIGARAEPGHPAAIAAHTGHRLAEVEVLWRSLEASGIESPGQSFDFTRLWVETQAITEADQFYIVGEVAGAPVALLALRRKPVKGVRQLAWFPGSHVGCNAPLVDRQRLATLTSDQRRALWHAMLAQAKGVDLVYLRAVPQLVVDGVDIFAELGNSLVGDTLYRAQFESWDEANTTQRSKSRRKHDRQQGERLDALGDVAFEELTGGPDAASVLDLMFHQRAARFVEMGVNDPFCAAGIRSFYDATVAPGSPVDVRLHALRLNGEIVALRYNIAHGDRLFCLISSMSDDPAIQGGSPGKQCLLRVMQTIFDAGWRTFDMGAGFTDEKRHWCNVQIPVRHHYIALTPLGAVATTLHRSWQVGRKRIKENKQLLGLIKSVRSRLQKATGGRTTEPKVEAED